MVSLLGAIFLGWSLGANDASNVFGTAVSSRMLRFRTAAILASVFVVAGAVLSGQAGIETLKGLTTIRLDQAVISSVAAALTVTIMTVVGLPVSTSQAVVGAILGIGILNNQLNISGLGKVVICWIGTPVGGAVIAVILYHLMALIYNRMHLNLIKSDILLRLLLIISGSYGAYALGANNVANVTAVFVGAGLLTVFWAALVVVTAMGITVHIYTLIGVPVSTSQAVVGAVLGIGIVKGTNTVSRSTLVNILLAWCLTPVVSCFLTLMIHFVAHLEYIAPLP